jgi:hypothetical protein
VSQEQADRRRSRRKVLGVVALTAVLALAALAVSLRVGIDRRWEAFERELGDMLAQVNDRAPRRTPHEDARHPGNAWDDYLALRTIVPNWSGTELNILYHYAARSDQSDSAAALLLLSATTGFTDLLSRGARRKECRYPFPEEERRWPRLPEDHFQHVAARAALVARSRARALLDEGKTREAVDLLLDLAVFGRDLADRSFDTDTMDGFGALDHALRGLQTLVISGRLRAEELLVLDRRLKALDDDWPDHDVALRSDLLGVGLLLVREDRAGGSMHEFSRRPRIRRHWRTFASTRLRALETFGEVRDRIRRVIDASRLPLEAGDPIIQAIDLEMRDSEDPLWGLCYNVGRLSSIRYQRCRLRLFRLAVHGRATGELLKLEDPMGGLLKIAETGNALRVWREDASGKPAPNLELIVERSDR